MARASRLSQLPDRPPLPPLPEHQEPQEDYTPVGPMAQRRAQELGVHRPIHMENRLMGYLIDRFSTNNPRKVDPFYSAQAVCVGLAHRATAAKPDAEYLLYSVDPTTPVIIEAYPEVIEVRAPAPGECELTGTPWAD